MPDSPSAFSAAPSALGYLYQVRYALVALLQAYDPESEISIEKLDDIAFESTGTAIELLQTKHRITHTGSLTDSSTDIWKTLRIWAASIKDGNARNCGQYPAAETRRRRCSSCLMQVM